jgi:uncharacterized membrane protein YidH (DUF202 family)
MVATELTQTRHTWHPTLSAGAVIGLTAFGVGLALVDPALAGSTRPHATLTGSLGDAAGILQNNARVLAAPFLLVLLGCPRSRLGRAVGDVIVTALTAASTIPVGVELGRWQGRLLPYLPQLPLEWAALALAVHAWVIARHDHLTIRQLAPLAVVVLGLLICAASLETWATPHRHGHHLDTARDTAVWRAAGCLSPGFCTGPGRFASRSHAPFPSLRSVPLGRLAGAAGISSTNRPPQGGIT